MILRCDFQARCVVGKVGDVVQPCDHREHGQDPDREVKGRDADAEATADLEDRGRGVALNQIADGHHQIGIEQVGVFDRLPDDSPAVIGGHGPVTEDRKVPHTFSLRAFQDFGFGSICVNRLRGQRRRSP